MSTGSARSTTRSGRRDRRIAGCPSALADLAAYAPVEDTSWKDVWTNQLSFSCQGDRLIVVSPGPDRQLGTDDDIRTGD